MVMKKSVQPVIFYFLPKQNKTHHSWISVTICSEIFRWLCHLMNVEMLEHSPFCREHSECITSLPHSRCSINDTGSSTRFMSTYPQPIADRFHRSLIQLPEEMTFVFVPCSCQHPSESPWLLSISGPHLSQIFPLLGIVPPHSSLSCFLIQTYLSISCFLRTLLGGDFLSSKDMAKNG